MYSIIFIYIHIYTVSIKRCVVDLNHQHETSKNQFSKPVFFGKLIFPPKKKKHKAISKNDEENTSSPRPQLGDQHHFLSFLFSEAGNCFVQCAFCAEKGGSSSDQAGKPPFPGSGVGDFVEGGVKGGFVKGGKPALAVP